MKRHPLLVGFSLMAVLVAVIPGSPAHAGRGPVFSMPKSVSMIADDGDTVYKNVKFTNKGDKKTGALQVTLDVPGPIMISDNNCQGARVKPGKSCITTLEFYADGPGGAEGELVISGPAQMAATNVSIEGRSTSTTMSVDPSNYSFGSASEGSKTFTFTNNTSGPSPGNSPSTSPRRALASTFKMAAAAAGQCRSLLAHRAPSMWASTAPMRTLSMGSCTSRTASPPFLMWP